MKFLKPKFWDKNHLSFFSILLFPISILIKVVNFFKNIFNKKYVFNIPVICVGNIYLGGTGKTPICIELFNILKNLNKNPAFIRKKYSSYKDEIDLLKNIGPTYEEKKRVSAINAAIKDNANVAILDDGFQDLSIKKDLSIVCFNEKQWIGNGLTIPSGPLRESLSALKRADFVIINGNKNDVIESEILKNNQSIKIFYIKYMPSNINEFKNKKVISFAGIGNPDNFFNILKKNSVNLIDQISFPDHYNYSNLEIESLIKKSQEGNIILLTTEKDFMRIPKKYEKYFRFLKIKIEIENKDYFTKELRKIYENY